MRVWHCGLRLDEYDGCVLAGEKKKSVVIERMLGYVLFGGPHVVMPFRGGALERWPRQVLTALVGVVPMVCKRSP